MPTGGRKPRRAPRLSCATGSKRPPDRKAFRDRRVILLCWQLAAGKGLLLTASVTIDSHKALRVHLDKEFIRHGV